MKIYYVTCDYGDGSNGVRWFKQGDEERLEALLAKDEYWGNEGSYHIVTLPDDIDLSSTGIRFS